MYRLIIENQTMNTWRLIIHPPYPGAWNMAVDESILESVSAKNEPPTLRLYDWSPYCLSLGYAQPFSDVNFDKLKANNWSLVRRPTGGKAILHADEMTYSVCAPIDDPTIKGNVLESYQIISNALLRSLKIIGIDADSKSKSPKDLHLTNNPVCFQFPSDYEITFKDKKLIGSAQARKKNGILQHGSIPIFGDITRIIEVLNFSDHFSMQDARDRLNLKATTLEQALGKDLPWFGFATAIHDGFEKQLSIKLIQRNLSKQELESAKRIYHEKYINNAWTLRI
jgi:lipoyl(octanoyl) transferase